MASGHACTSLHLVHVFTSAGSVRPLTDEAAAAGLPALGTLPLCVASQTQHQQGGRKTVLIAKHTMRSCSPAPHRAPRVLGAERCTFRQSQVPDGCAVFTALLERVLMMAEQALLSPGATHRGRLLPAQDLELTLQTQDCRRDDRVRRSVSTDPEGQWSCCCPIATVSL